jgi:hypothetical protein
MLIGLMTVGSSLACSSSSSPPAPVIDSFSAPASATADESGNYTIDATFSAHDNGSTITSVDIQATGLKDNPIATDNQSTYTNQPFQLTLEGATKGQFAYTFVVTNAAGESASSPQTITLE